MAHVAMQQNDETGSPMTMGEITSATSSMAARRGTEDKQRLSCPSNSAVCTGRPPTAPFSGEAPTEYRAIVSSRNEQRRPQITRTVAVRCASGRCVIQWLHSTVTGKVSPEIAPAGGRSRTS